MVVGERSPATSASSCRRGPRSWASTSHLERRELGVVNVGETGHVLVDGEKFELGHLDGLYVGRGSEVAFTGADAAFYFVSAPAGATYPTTALVHDEVERGGASAPPQGASERTLFRYAWGSELQTATLQFGVTVLADGSVWNTLPPHLHDRRTEVYLYVDLADDEPGLPLPRQARRHPAPRDAQPAGRHLAPVVHPRRRGHQLLRLHLGDVR